MTSVVNAYRSSGGARIYRMHLDLFPILSGFAYLVFADDEVVLIDVGSGFGESNYQLEAAMQQVRTEFGETADWDDLTSILITHGHIDHFGGLHYVKQRTHARVGIHELDLRVLANYEDRLKIMEHRMREFLVETGVGEKELLGIMTLYLLNKHLFSSLSPDFTYEAVGMQVGPFRLVHVPGHCPGQVVIYLDDVMFSSDHVLQDTSPHQAPERLSLSTGLGHYLESLRRVRSLPGSIRLALGGHGKPIEDLAGRIKEIEQLHKERLMLVFDLLNEPKTTAEISHALFPDVEGYHKLLALEETTAHIEYLAQRGYLRIDNINDLDFHSPAPIRYSNLGGEDRLQSAFEIMAPRESITPS